MWRILAAPRFAAITNLNCANNRTGQSRLMHAEGEDVAQQIVRLCREAGRNCPKSFATTPETRIRSPVSTRMAPNINKITYGLPAL
jgi:hypothetical protein